MIPTEDEEEKTIIKSFIDSLDSPSWDKNTHFKKMLSELFSNACLTMDSYDQWHDYLAGYGIILVKSRNTREMYKEKWHSWAQGRFVVLNNPAEKGIDEMMLVPHKTVEKMILLGMLK